MPDTTLTADAGAEGGSRADGTGGPGNMMESFVTITPAGSVPPAVGTARSASPASTVPAASLLGSSPLTPVGGGGGGERPAGAAAAGTGVSPLYDTGVSRDPTRSERVLSGFFGGWTGPSVGGGSSNDMNGTFTSCLSTQVSPPPTVPGSVALPPAALGPRALGPVM